MFLSVSAFFGLHRQNRDASDKNCKVQPNLMNIHSHSCQKWPGPILNAAQFGKPPLLLNHNIDFFHRQNLALNPFGNLH